MIIVVVFGGLFVAADRIAVNMAESEVADRVRSSQGLTGTPSVSIKGFPFLTQVFSKELDGVDVGLKTVTATADGRPVNITEVRAELSNVKINSDFSSAVADTADGSGRVSYEDLTRAAPQGATVAYAGPERAAKGQVKVSGSLLDLLKNAGKDPGRFESLLKREITVYSSVELREGGTVRLRTESLPGLSVPGLDGMLRDVLDYDLELKGLPKPVTLDKVTAEKDGLKFSGTGRNVSLVG
ncbi:DUF2993 domain-containing protein [Streptomyces qinzhouensis]|uniref:DUF2993 domain-containing protein n=1 Tax=Streptomyces qinzhouensis TaxID=2599401 RepID=A0A5B8JHN9_9ACTN|nr:DUF2993 domain-containing protein [Streptomyces qinzhouensis]